MSGNQAVESRMYLVRLHLKTGGVIGYLYMDMGRGHAAKELVAKALEVSRRHPPLPAIFRIDDDAGQEANWDGADVSGVSFVDSLAEVVFNTRLEIMTLRAKGEMLQRAGITLNQGQEAAAGFGGNGQDQEPTPRPAGMIGGFAS